MSNGEGFCGGISETPSPDPINDEFILDGVFPKLDSPVSSSRYSSCGESEFERYCSANSVLGTPSMCSSVGAFQDCGGSEFGESMRSFGGSEGEFGLEGFTLNEGFGNVMSSSGGLVEERIIGDSMLDGYEEHSEGEDSMFNYGSDGENRSNAHYVRRAGYECEAESGGGNVILMGPSVAFGSDDWDDSELGRAENDSASGMLDKFDRQERDGGVSGVPRDESRIGSSVNTVDCFKSREKKVVEAASDAFVSCKKAHSDDESIECLEGCDAHNIFEIPNPLSDMGTTNGITAITDKDNHFPVAKNRDRVCIEEEQLGYTPDMMLGQVPKYCSGKCTFGDFATNYALNDEKAEASDEYKLGSLPLGPGDNMGRIRNELNHTEAKLPPRKGKSLELNAFHDEVVLDMEEVLLDSVDSPVTRRNKSSLSFHSDQPSTLRDDGSTASTSDAVDQYPLTFQHARIDGIEVVGAKQKKGDVSLSERLVGVKEHTVYVIRVWSGEDQWEVERRYRDFYTLYRRLKSLFADQGWVLPSSWSAVEWESRNVFGSSSPDVVLERSALIQECLNSVLRFSYPSGSPNALIWFLSPPKAPHVSPQSNSPHYQSTIGSHTENISTFGNTISLIVDVPPHKTVKQTLEEQHYTCPGCHKHLDGGKTLFQEFVQTFGLGKPRRCEYTGRLFCSSCHTNDAAVLPARVLHHWDFTEYPVSQLAKLYLDSITDQPMLCVSAVNPFLLSKVKVLLHVVNLRRKMKALLGYVHCSFRGTIYRGLGSRRYLLESADFFSLTSLIDLSRGAFGALPVILETILKKMEEHITEQCLVCCDIGAPCAARQTCNDTSSLIFPFQDKDEARRCPSCKLPFHKRCFAKLDECPCGTRLKVDRTRSMSRLSLITSGGDGIADGALSLFRMKSDLGLRSSSALLSKLLSSGKKDNSEVSHQEGQNIILMGSLPGNSF